jgi:hypothetical protein
MQGQFMPTGRLSFTVFPRGSLKRQGARARKERDPRKSSSLWHRPRGKEKMVLSPDIYHWSKDRLTKKAYS